VIFFRTFAYIFKQRSLNNKKLSKKVGSANELKTNTTWKKKYVGLLPNLLPQGWFGIKTTVA